MASVADKYPYVMVKRHRRAAAPIFLGLFCGNNYFGSISQECGMVDDPDLQPPDALESSGFQFFLVSHVVWTKVKGLVGESKNLHLQLVPQGSEPYDTAGRAVTWLHQHDKKLTQLTIVAHGGPGSFVLGVGVTKDNAAPLGGWFRSFFDGRNGTGIQILGCECAADSVQNIAGASVGQANSRASGLSRNGYLLLRELADASGQKVEGALNGQSIDPLGLKGTCRRVFPGGSESLFNAVTTRSPGR